MGTILGCQRAVAADIGRFGAEGFQPDFAGDPKGPGDGADATWKVVLKVVLTMQFVVFTRILFRAEDLENAGAVTDQLLLGTTGTANVAPALWLTLLTGFAVHYTPRRWYEAPRARFATLPAWAQGAIFALVLAGLMLVANGQTVPYIYFQF